MSATVRPANGYQARAVDRTLELLHDALAMANVAKCPRLARAIRQAIASGKGAKRHLVRRRVVYAVLHVTNTDRKAFNHVEPPTEKQLKPIPATYRFPYREDSISA